MISRLNFFTFYTYSLLLIHDAINIQASIISHWQKLSSEVYIAFVLSRIKSDNKLSPVSSSTSPILWSQQHSKQVQYYKINISHRDDNLTSSYCLLID